MEIPDVRYARSGDVAIAYQVVGDGPVDVVWFRGMAGDLLSTWDQSLIVRHASGLAVLSRLLMLDKRGTGLSDRVREAPTLETRMDDVRAVMDAAVSFFRTRKEADVSDIRSSVGVPTLILCKPELRAEAEYVAARIPASEVAELPGLSGLFTWIDDEVHEQTMRETAQFLTSLGRPKEPDRVLATVLFT